MRNAIAEEGKFSVANLRMILRGKALKDEEDGDDLYVTLKDQGNRFCSKVKHHSNLIMQHSWFCCVDSLMVAVIPKPPAGAENFDDDDDDDVLVKYRCLI